VAWETSQFQGTACLCLHPTSDVYKTQSGRVEKQSSICAAHLSGYNKVGIPFIQFRQSYANGGAAEKSALKLTSGRLHLIVVHTASNGP